MKCMLIQEHQNRSNWSFDKNAKDFSGTGFSAFFWRRIPHWIYWKGVGNLNFCISVNFYLSLYLLSRKHSRLSGLSRLHQYRHIGRTPELNKVSQLQCHWGDENDDDRLQDWEYQTYYISKRCDLNSAGVEVMIFKPSSNYFGTAVHLPVASKEVLDGVGGRRLVTGMKSKGFKLGGQLGEICVVVGVRRVGVAEKRGGALLIKRSDRKGPVFQNNCRYWANLCPARAVFM